MDIPTLHKCQCSIYYTHFELDFELTFNNIYIGDRRLTDWNCLEVINGISESIYICMYVLCIDLRKYARLGSARMPIFFVLFFLFFFYSVSEIIWMSIDYAQFIIWDTNTNTKSLLFFYHSIDFCFFFSSFSFVICLFFFGLTGNWNKTNSFCLINFLTTVIVLLLFF